MHLQIMPTWSIEFDLHRDWFNVPHPGIPQGIPLGPAHLCQHLHPEATHDRGKVAEHVLTGGGEEGGVVEGELPTEDIEVMTLYLLSPSLESSFVVEWLQLLFPSELSWDRLRLRPRLSLINKIKIIVSLLLIIAYMWPPVPELYPIPQPLVS